MSVGFKAILAVDANGGIGKGNTLPWLDKGDLRNFKSNTLYQTIVMGWNTFQSLNDSRLENRNYVVIYDESKVDIDAKKIMIANVLFHGVNFITEQMFELALGELDNYNEMKLNELDSTKWLIGGAKIFNKYLRYCDEVLLSRTDKIFDCDTFVDLSILDEQFTLVETTPLEDSIFTVYKYQKKT